MFGPNSLFLLAWLGAISSLLLVLGVSVFGAFVFSEEPDWIGFASVAGLLTFVSGAAYSCVTYIGYPSVAMWGWRTASVIGILLCSMGVVSSLHKRGSFSVGPKKHLAVVASLATLLASFAVAALVWDVNPSRRSGAPEPVISTRFPSEWVTLLWNVWIPLLIISVVVVLLNGFVSSERSRTDAPRYDTAKNSAEWLSERATQIARLEERLESFGPRTLAYRFEEIGERLSRILVTELRSSTRDWGELMRSILGETRSDLSSEIKSLISATPLAATGDVDRGMSLEQQDLRNIIADTIRIESERFLLALGKSRTDGSLAGFQTQSQPLGLVPIRELYHYLFTPLSQIEVAIQLSAAKLEQLNCFDPVEESLETVWASVEVCKSVLAAYRELSVVSPGEDWQPRSAGEGLVSAAMVYSSRTGKEVHVEANFTEEPPEYSTNFLIAIVLPLLENAIAAAANGSTVRLTGFTAGKQYTIEVVNVVEDIPSVSRFFEPGFSTKPNHEGTGLSTVKRLVETQREASVTVEANGHLVRFLINLPIGARE